MCFEKVLAMYDSSNDYAIGSCKKNRGCENYEGDGFSICSGDWWGALKEKMMFISKLELGSRLGEPDITINSG